MVGVGKGRTADMYHSDRLGATLPPPSGADPAGQFVVIYESDPAGSIKTALLSVGGIPKGS
jgi:hypothetical protein